MVGRNIGIYISVFGSFQLKWGEIPPLANYLIHGFPDNPLVET